MAVTRTATVVVNLTIRGHFRLTCLSSHLSLPLVRVGQVFFRSFPPLTQLSRAICRVCRLLDIYCVVWDKGYRMVGIHRMILSAIYFTRLYFLFLPLPVRRKWLTPQIPLTCFLLSDLPVKTYVNLLRFCTLTLFIYAYLYMLVF